MIEFQKEQIQAILPSAKDSNIDLYLGPINTTLAEFEINTALRAAAFIAQIGEESANLLCAEENLNYSADALIKLFPTHFNSGGVADLYARKPISIANRLYANRMGNGAESTGDGWRYHGRGLIQITGKNNYVDFALYEQKASDPNYLKTPEGAARSAGWFWSQNKLNELADQKDIKEITRKINGGYIGLDVRMANYDRALQVLGV